MSKSFPIRFGLALVLAAASITACKKVPPPTAESLARHGPHAMDEGTPPEPIVVPDGGSREANLSELSSALRRYIAGSHQIPKDFDDFLAKSGVQPPAPPAGKKYVIQGQVIVLADKSAR